MCGLNGAPAVWQRYVCVLSVVLVCDNGPQFPSYEFEMFMFTNGIKHKTSAPFKPSSNGQAERYVYTLKQALHAMQHYAGSVSQN